jgi:hypothetical protein
MSGTPGGHWEMTPAEYGGEHVGAAAERMEVNDEGCTAAAPNDCAGVSEPSYFHAREMKNEMQQIINCPYMRGLHSTDRKASTRSNN